MVHTLRIRIDHSVFGYAPSATVEAGRDERQSRMAIRGAIPMRFEDVFPNGCFVVGDVAPLRDFDRSTKDQAVQAVDRDTGVLLWTVDVVDADPEARERTVRVRLVAPV